MAGTMKWISWKGLAMVLFLLPGILFPPALAGSIPVEYEVKAAYLINFIKFVEWPDSAFQSAEDTLVLCVVGNDPIEVALEKFNGKTVSGKVLDIRKVADPASMGRCHILFVGESEKGKVDKVLGALKKLPVLTVSDIDGFARRGGAIGFVREKSNIRFEINDESAGNAGLTLNAKLLYLGKIVRGHKTSGD
jgi:hypothetical protein